MYISMSECQESMYALAVKYNFKLKIKYWQQSKVFGLKQKSKNGKKNGRKTDKSVISHLIFSSALKS